MADADYEAFNQIFTENNAWLRAYIDARLRYPIGEAKERKALANGLGALAIIDDELPARSEDELMKAYADREKLLWQHNPDWAAEEMRRNPLHQRAVNGLVDLLIEEDVSQHKLEAS